MTLDAVPTMQPSEVGASFLVDVREDDEWADGHAPGALHIPLNDIPVRVGELPQDRPIAVICRVGSRSAYATAWLVEQGYDARNVAGGMLAWGASGLPVEIP